MDNTSAAIVFFALGAIYIAPHITVRVAIFTGGWFAGLGCLALYLK